eukprot:3925142-Rhodomonas_salina.2
MRSLGHRLARTAPLASGLNLWRVLRRTLAAAALAALEKFEATAREGGSAERGGREMDTTCSATENLSSEEEGERGGGSGIREGRERKGRRERGESKESAQELSLKTPREVRERRVYEPTTPRHVSGHVDDQLEVS